MARNATAETFDDDRSLGTVVKELTADLSTLFRSEIALLKLEVKDTVSKLSGGAAMFLAAAFLRVFGLGFLFVTIVLGLVRLGVPAWLSTLVVTVALLGAAAVLAVMGKKKFAALQFVPSASIQNIKTDVQTIKDDISRDRIRVV